MKLKQYKLTVRATSEQDFWILGESKAAAKERFWNEPDHCSLSDDETTSIDVVAVVELGANDPDYDQEEK